MCWVFSWITLSTQHNQRYKTRFTQTNRFCLGSLAVPSVGHLVSMLPPRLMADCPVNIAGCFWAYYRSFDRWPSSECLLHVCFWCLMRFCQIQIQEKKNPHTCICGMWNRLTRETNHMKEIKQINKSLFTCEAPTATSLDLRCNSSLGLPSQLTRSSHIKGKWNGKWARQLREAGRENKKKKMGSNLKAF